MYIGLHYTLPCPIWKKAVLHLQVSSVPYDERPLPALQRKGRPVEVVHSPAEQYSPGSDTQTTPQSPEMSGEPEPLTQKAQREAGLSIEVYGESLVRRWVDKTRLVNTNLLSQGFFISGIYPGIPFGTCWGIFSAIGYYIALFLLIFRSVYLSDK